MLCNICPRRCGAERTETRGGGVCAMPAGIVAAKAMLHQWEEPVLSGTNGAGCVFFSGCNLGCVFCQNGKISHENFGKVLSPARLREIFFELIAQGAHCIDLVSPTHFTPWVCEALADPLPVPVVWNSGGYERVETLKTLEGRVQIYLPDLKYALEKPARELSCAGDYFPVAAAAIDEMLRQVGPYQIGDDGLMKSGVIIRHLVLPGQLENTKAIIDYVSAHFPPHTVLFSLMSQYTPQPGASGALARRLNHAEYRAAVRYMTDCGITDGFCPAQKRSIHRFLICRGSSMTDKRQFSCLRCGAGMRFIGRDKFQRRPDLFLSDLTFALAGGMEVDIYSCPTCGKLELFQPEAPSDGLAQKQCPVCGAVIDFDYGRCPRCRREF